MAASGIEYITIKGFKSIKSIENLKLNPINILIGANGSGKSNFLEAFRLLGKAGADYSLKTYVVEAGGADKLLYFGSEYTREIYLGITASTGDLLEVTLRATTDDNLVNVSFWTLPTDLSPSERQARLSQRVFDLLSSPLNGVLPYHLHNPAAMRKTAEVHNNRRLEPDGGNLAACLYLLQQKHPSVFAMITQTVQLVAPFFDGFYLSPLRLNEATIRLEWRHKHSGQILGASSLSDGTLRFIALATLLHQPVELRPSTILIDEPELGLHPFAVTILAALIQKASIDTQVIVATQSPQLLDHFEPEDVLVADRTESGTQLTRPDSRRLKVWLEDYSLGQLWEKNEIGGRPGSF